MNTRQIDHMLDSETTVDGAIRGARDELVYTALTFVGPLTTAGISARTGIRSRFIPPALRRLRRRGQVISTTSAAGGASIWRAVIDVESDL